MVSHFTSRTSFLNKPVPWTAVSNRDLFHLYMLETLKMSSVDVNARVGYHFIFHPTDELPTDSSAHYHQANQHSIFNVFPHQTLISEEMRRISYRRRNCYFQQEKRLKFFKIYSKPSCEHECQSFAFARQCGCVPFYLLS
jgi:Amiloride-sensitive sodium channel